MNQLESNESSIHPSNIGFNELCKLAFDRWEFFVKIWDVYKIVSLAILGFVVATPGIRSNLTMIFVASFGFLGFAACHFMGMISVRDQIEALSHAAKTRVSGTDAALLSLCTKLAPPSWWKLAAFHLFLDVGYLVALLVINSSG